VNNRHELGAWRARFPGSVVHELPVGCTLREAPRFHTDFDLVADGKCHYACSQCGQDWKRRSIEALVLPLLGSGASLNLYGPRGTSCGWHHVPGTGPHTRGIYPAATYADVYARHKVYVGISWNWGLGGYGIKLARALATGIPVLWHRTLGMAEDGLIAGRHLVTSAAPEETRLRVRELLIDKDRAEALGAEGQAFALREWRWGPNLLRLLDEVRRDR
jgi:glycosyltransferase involved in cell wall biosynthesis